MRFPDRSSGSASPRFSRQSRMQGRFVRTHDDPGVGAADEMLAVAVHFESSNIELSHVFLLIEHHNDGQSILVIDTK